VSYHEKHRRDKMSKIANRNEYISYKYSVIRAVPNPIREEAVNVGMVLIDENKRMVRYKFIRNAELRVKKIDPEFSPEAIRAFRRDFEEILGQSDRQYKMELWHREKNVSEAISRMADAYAGQIQFTPVRTTWASSVDEAFGKLYGQLVELPERVKPLGFLSRRGLKERAWNQLSLFSPPGEAKYDERLNGRSGATYILDTVFHNREVRAMFYSISFKTPRIEEIVLHRGYLLGATIDIRRVSQYEGIAVYAVMTKPLNQTEKEYKESESSFATEKIRTVLLEDLPSIKGEIASLVRN
jgi:hypothetical protein